MKLYIYIQLYLGFLIVTSVDVHSRTTKRLPEFHSVAKVNH